MARMAYTTAEAPMSAAMLMASSAGTCRSSQPTMRQLDSGMRGPNGKRNSPALGRPSRWRTRSTARLTPRSMSSSDPVANTARYLNVPLNAKTQTTTAKKITATCGVLYSGWTFDRKLGRLSSSDDANMTLGAPSMSPLIAP